MAARDYKFEYMLLNRLQCDCNYYLGHGGRNAQHCLWAHDEGCVAIIVASSDALGTTKLANMALKFFGKEGYNISILGLLGPFKKLN